MHAGISQTSRPVPSVLERINLFANAMKRWTGSEPFRTGTIHIKRLTLRSRTGGGTEPVSPQGI
jgi:hypothetical protein